MSMPRPADLGLLPASQIIDAGVSLGLDQNRATGIGAYLTRPLGMWLLFNDY